MSKINVIGASCIDILISSADRKLLFSPGYKAGRIASSFGGDALNEALVMRKLGSDVSLKTILGSDTCGNLIRQHLSASGIGYDENILKDGIDTYISLVLIDEDGQRHFTGGEDGSVRLFDAEEISVDEDCEIVSFASMFISKVMDDGKYERFFKKMKDKGILLCADCSMPKNKEKARDLHCLSRIDWFFCNESEASALCGSDDPYECEEILLDQGIGNVVIKLGSRGCLHGGKIHPPLKKIGCLDSTGAGDTFVASFIHCLGRGMDIGGCIAFANGCAGRCCERIGATAWLEDI